MRQGALLNQQIACNTSQQSEYKLKFLYGNNFWRPIGSMFYKRRLVASVYLYLNFQYVCDFTIKKSIHSTIIHMITTFTCSISFYDFLLSKGDLESLEGFK